MPFMNWIVQRLNDASYACYEFYLALFEWGGFFREAADTFYWLSETFANIAWDFSDFFSWLLTEAEKWKQILSWDTIWSWILTLVPNLEEIRDWFYSWWEWVDERVTQWWSGVQSTVQGWIAAATAGLTDLLAAWDNFWNITWPEWIGNLSELRSLWDDFWVNTLPNLVDFTWLGTWWDSRLKEVNDLIEAAIKSWFPFWESLANLWAEIEEFFTDPLQWLYDKLDEWFERFW